MTAVGCAGMRSRMDRMALLAAFEPGSSDGALADALAALWDAARAAWPGVNVPGDGFMRHLASRARGDLGALRSADLYLAFACLQNDPVALRLLDEHVIARLDKAIAGVDSRQDVVDEIRQRVRERLLVPDGAQPPRLVEYAGQGSLLGWARTVAVRLTLNQRRDLGREEPSDDAVLAELPLSGRDVELEYVRAQHRQDFTAAFRDALAGLEPRARNILRLSYVDRLSIDQIGAIYGAHRATAARWLNAARDELVASTRTRLAERLKLTTSDLDSLLGVLQSNLEVSLNRFLGAGSLR